jgi:hypothetical protein
VSLDASDREGVIEKARSLRELPIDFLDQGGQLENPDSRIILEKIDKSNFFKQHAKSRYGLRTADSPRFISKFWEVPFVNKDWRFHQSTVDETRLYGGRENILYWEDGSGDLKEYDDKGKASIQGEDAWREMGVAVSLMRDLSVTIHRGGSFDNNCAIVWPKKENNLEAIWTFCNSNKFEEKVRKIDQSLKVMNQTLLKVPFDLDHW